MRTLCQPHDSCQSFTTPLPTAKSTQPAENTELSYLAIDWRAACLLLWYQEARLHASDRDIHRKRTAPLSPHRRKGKSAKAGRALALPAVLLQKGLSPPGQCSRRGGCGSGRAPVRLQAPRPIQGAVANVDVVDCHCH